MWDYEGDSLMAYQIVEWLYNQLDDEDFEDLDTLKEAIRAKDEGDNKIKGWLDSYSANSWVDQDYKGTSLSDGITEEEEIEALKGQIEAATNRDELPELSSAQVGRQYGKEAREEYSEALAEKGEELDSLEQELEKEVQQEINQATTVVELEAIDTSQGVTTAQDKRFEDLVDSKIQSLEP